MSSPFCAFQLDNAQIFKTIFDILAGEMETCTLHLSNDGIAIHGMDSTHISLIQISLFQSSFSHFHFPDTQTSHRISVSLDTFTKIFKSVTPDDSVKFTIKTPGAPYVHVQFKNSLRRHAYRVNILDIEEEDINISSFDYSTQWQTEATTFKRICDEMGHINDGYITFRYTDEKVHICTDSIGCESEIMLENIVGQQTGNPLDSKVSLPKVHHFSGFSKLCNVVHIRSSDAYPLLLEFPFISDSEELIGFAKCHIAPCIDD